MRFAGPLTALPFALALLANTAPPADRAYELAISITDNGDMVGQPKLKVKEGEAATIHIEPGDGRTYRATFVIDAKDDGSFGVKSEWNATSPTLGTVSFKPEMKVAQGEEAHIVYGNEAPGVSPLDVKYTVTLAR